MFAVAVWDVKRERLILGRDRIGEKPLYVRRGITQILFASELKSILQVEDVPTRLNFDALQEYLALGYVPAPLTMIDGVEKVLPGHCLIIEKGRCEDSEYWEVPFAETEVRTEQEWTEQLREKILETVKAQLISDVPLGAFLSGGVDSSAIVAAMAKLTGRSVKTYSIGYEGKHSYYNELGYAKLVANAFSTDHHEIIVRPEMTELLPKLVWHLDEPVADSACLTTYLVSKLARQSVTVILSGVGGDELFGGYRRYLGDSVLAWYRLLPHSIRQRWLPALLKRLPRGRSSALKDYARYAAAFMETAEQESARRYMSYVTLFSPQVQRELLCQHAVSDPERQDDSAKALHRYFARYPGDDSLQRIIYADLKTSLPDDLLALTDRMSMAASIECRAPLVDHELIELTTRIPSSLKVRGLSLKYLLKKAVAPWLPHEIVNRKKRGFGAPVGSWMREDLQPLISELLSQEQVQRRGLFQWRTIKQLLEAHQQQRFDYTDQLFALIVFELWCRNFLDGKFAVQDASTFRSVAFPP
jgi:asparagine synthase (glutamine-hydrolysing)